MKRCSTPYVIRKCKLKQRDTSTHLLEWPKSRTLTTSTQPGCGATGTLIYCWWECNVVQPLRKTVRQDLTKLNRLLSYDPAITPLEIYPKKLKTRPHKNLHMDVYSSFIHNCQNLEETKMSFSRWMDKSIMIHPDNKILFNAKKKWDSKPWKDKEKS